MSKLKVEQWPIEKLIPYARNPRKNDAQVDRMVSAIKEFGFRIPVVAKSDGSVVDGHLRLKAAQKLGLKEVPVALADELTDAQVKAFRLLANKSANWAEWDDELLRLELDELKGMDFDLSLTGFDSVELDDVFALATGGTEGLTDADDCPEVQETPVTKEGDVWLLGKHRLMCGDSTDAGSVCLLMQNEKADMVFTDPPYGVNVGGSKTSSNKHLKIAGDLTQTVIPFAFENVVNVATKDNARFYFCGSEGNIMMYIKLFERFLNQLPKMLIWVKNGFVIKQNGYHNAYEIIFYGFKPGGGNKWFNERTEDCASDVWKIKRDAVQNYVHPTQKPVEIAERAIKNSSEKDSVVYEPFGGSGSTLIACEKTGRVCRMMELSPHYCDVIVKRWQDFTGQKATREGDGKMFDEVANV